jgi:hypothetical protein
MSVIETGNYELSDAELASVKEAAKEAAAALLRIDAEKDLMKEIAAKIKEEFKVKPADFNYLAQRYHKQDVERIKAQAENKAGFYEQVFSEEE